MVSLFVNLLQSWALSLVFDPHSGFPEHHWSFIILRFIRVIRIEYPWIPDGFIMWAGFGIPLGVQVPIYIPLWVLLRVYLWVILKALLWVPLTLRVLLWVLLWVLPKFIL